MQQGKMKIVSAQALNGFNPPHWSSDSAVKQRTWKTKEFNSGNMRRKQSRSLTFQGHFRDRIEMLLSAQTFVGQVLVILVFVLSIGSLIIYFINSTDPVRSCSSYHDRTIPIDLTFNAFFSFYFGLRFLAADDKLKFWLEMNSIVDIFTIPPTFISYYLKSNWLGLRFLRALRLLELPQILQILQAISTRQDTVSLRNVTVAKVLFANYVPEMVELLANERKYTSSYEVVKGKKFIVVCGNITVDSVMAFLRNFLRHKAGEINTEIVFLGEVLPSLELETIFKCHMAYTTFISGSALKWEDLRRVAIPSWNWNTGDNIICFGELTLGFIAQGCLVPGLCTFLTSLFVEQNKKICPHEPWQQLFCNGLKNKILTQHLSSDFAGMSFPDACQLCFTKMHLLLIAIQHKSAFYGYWYHGLMLNPPAQVKLHKNTLGFFIAESAKHVKRAFFYCAICHSDVQTPELIEKCECKGKARRATGKWNLQTTSGFSEPLPLSFPLSFLFYNWLVKADSRQAKLQSRQAALYLSSCLQRMRSFWDDKTFHIASTPQPIRSAVNIGIAWNFFCETEEEIDRLDSSGMFHWCRATPLNKMILKRTDKAKYEFRNHIVACVFGDAHSTLIGLRNFVMPLRASNYTRQELKDIVFVGSLDYLQREWRFIRNFPQIYILPGSALYSVDLHAVNIEECSMCAVLSSSCKSPSSPTLVDTEPIMATLNIGHLRISCSAQTPSGPQFAQYFSSNPRKSKCRRIPILTELKNPSNIHFIEQLSGMEGNFSGTNLHLSTAFATGTVFSGSFLDSLLATAFYNYHVVELLQMLVTGGMNFQLEQHLDKEKLFELNTGYSTILSGKMRCKLGLLSLNQTILSDIEVPPRRVNPTPRASDCPVHTAFQSSIHGPVLQISVVLGSSSKVDLFVITRPENEFSLLPSDLVFCAIPFSTSCYKKDSKASPPCEIINIKPQKEETVQDSRKLADAAKRIPEKERPRDQSRANAGTAHA
ncbi:hypothetical protein MG293_020273 [Ovis ammon polii]|uniref:BK channel n=1 Tax=Ovis ammon polii TaxID=230172 RepID=A0AAD4TQ64_OVIAM|nr:hypothetical protein MG293_020273 [Ovis ammon polii]